MEYFKLGDLDKSPKFIELSRYLDDFVVNEIDNLHLEHNFSAYNSIIKEISKSLKIHPDEKSISKMERLVSWIKNIIIPERELQKKRNKYANPSN